EDRGRRTEDRQGTRSLGLRSLVPGLHHVQGRIQGSSMATRLDPLEYLERDDKWYLGGGRGAMFAPAFPRWLDRFGFWDEAYFADVRLERLYTVLVLAEDERPLALRREQRRWTPDALTQTYVTPDGLRIREDKVVTQHDTLACRLGV